MLDMFLRDLRYAARALAQRARFTIAATLTLALGIGANAGMFSILYGIVLRPLPYPNADRLVLIEAERLLVGTQQPVTAYFPLTAVDIWGARSSFESVALYAGDGGAFSNGSRTEVVEFATVSGSFFSTLGGGVRLGRPLGPADDAAPFIVISEGLWRRAFGGATDVIGQQVMLNSQRGDGGQRALWRRAPFTIVGVAHATTQFPSPETDVWTTAGYVSTVFPRCCSFSVIARLQPGATLDQANADAGLVAAALTAENPRDFAGLQARAAGLQEQLVRAVRPTLWLLFAAVGLVLFVACANVTNLLLARNATRQRDMAVRLALGASRGRLVSQALVESALLSTIGAAVGIAVAVGMVEAFRRLEPVGIPRLDSVHVDAAVLVFACAAAAVATLATGMLPALHSLRNSQALRMGGVAAASASGGRARRVLVTVELAVSVVLLVGAMLLGRSLFRLLETDLGVVTARVVTASLSLDVDRQLTAAQQTALIDRVVETFRGVPGTEAVGVGASLPPHANRIILTMRRTGDAGPVDYRAIAIPATPGYFSTLRIPLLRGRLFTEADDASRPQVIIMSAATARRFFGEGDPIGRTMSLPTFRDGVAAQAEMTLVGVIGDVKYSGLGQAPDDAVYRPFAQQPWPSVFLVARTAGDPAGLAQTLRERLSRIDPALSVTAVNTLDDVISDEAAQPRFRTLVLAALAGLALTLAAVGLYGVVGYSVSQRTGEIGVRMAIGASATDIIMMIVREGMQMATVGVALGIAGAYALARLLTGLLYGVAPNDAPSFAISCLSLLLFALIATYSPAYRATRIDPSIALRAE